MRGPGGAHAASAPRLSVGAATQDVVRGRLLDGADDLLRERTWASVSMADIARAGGVSRQTVYNTFGSREAFAQEYVLREVDGFLVAVEGAVLENRQDPRAAVAAAFDIFLSAAAERPLIRAIVAGDGADGLLALVTTHGGPVLRTATDALAGVMQAAWPQVPVGGARLVAELVVRLAISHAALPTGPADLTAASVARVVGPYLEQLLRDGAPAPG